MKEITKQWLESAQLDVENIRLILDSDRLTGHVAFHAQQAIEKSLKAVLEEKESHVPKIHTLQKLLSLCTPYIEISFDEELIIALDSLYIESRYPSDFGLLQDGKPTKKQTTVFFEFAQQVITQVQKSLQK